MKEINVTFYQTVGDVSFKFELSYLEDIDPSNYNKVGKLQFGGVEVTLYYVDRRVTIRPENLVLDAAYMEFEESPLEWTCKHLDGRVSTWMNDCMLKFNNAIECLV